MPFGRTAYLSFFLILSESSAFALSVGYGGANLSTPFELAYQPNTVPSIDLVLQLVNNSDTTVFVLSWQLELQLRPIEGVQGGLLFESVDTPPDSLFGESPGPQTDLSTPSAMLNAFDGDSTFQGQPITGATARNILQTKLIADSNAVGSFQLVMPEFNPESPDVGSSWFEAEGIAPSQFENVAPSAFSGFVLLGTITVDRSGNTAIPGDYNSDEAVNALDYDQWKAQFGSSVAIHGDGADGNRNGIIDAADYVVWRKRAGAEADILDSTQAIVPEPNSFWLLIFYLVGAIALYPKRPGPTYKRQLDRSPLGLEV